MFASVLLVSSSVGSYLLQYRGFCDVFNLCTVSLKFVQVSRILIFFKSHHDGTCPIMALVFLNSAVNVVVHKARVETIVQMSSQPRIT